MNTDQKSLSSRLNILAKSAGSAAALARKSEIAQTTMAGYVSGKFEPRASEILKIARASNVRPEWLLTGDGPMHGEEEVAPSSLHSKLPPLLPHLMEAVIEGMEIAIRERDMKMTTKQRALAITTLYGITYRRYLSRSAGGLLPTLDEEFNALAVAPDGEDLLRLMAEGNDRIEK